MVNWLDTYFKDREMFFKENKNNKEYYNIKKIINT